MGTQTPSPADIPVPAVHIEAAAVRHGVEEAALRDALATIHRNLIDDNEALYDRYAAGGGPDPVTRLDGLVSVLFVEPSTWERVLEHPSGLEPAIKSAHAGFARDVCSGLAVRDGREPLVVPSEKIAQLVEAGLSLRQAQVQVLEDSGLEEADIADRLGVSTNTVKVHRHRIDAKLEDARQLLGMVDS